MTVVASLVPLQALALAAAVLAAPAVVLTRAGNEIWAFGATATTIAAAVLTLCGGLYPPVLVAGVATPSVDIPSTSGTMVCSSSV